MKFSCIIISFLSLNLYSQTFYITPGLYPVFDQKSNYIYYYTLFLDDSTGRPLEQIRRTDISGLDTHRVKLPGLPSFANNSSRAIFTFQESDYDPRFSDWSGGCYYFDTEKEDSITLLFPIEDVQHYSFWRCFSEVLFSPDDSKFLIFPYLSFAYYSFVDSSIHDPGHEIYSDVLPQWSSDTTLLFVPMGGDVRIIEYNYSSNRFDTLVYKEYPPISFEDFSYNTDSNLIMYSSINLLSDTLQQLFLLDLNTGNERNIFHDFGGRYPDYNFHTLVHVQWSPDNDKAIINSEAAIGHPDSRIILYYTDNDLLILYEEEAYDWDRRANIQWYNNDTLLYESVSKILGFSTSFPLKIVGENKYPIMDYYLYQNYPNPFNSSTNIHFELLSPSQVELSIYDISGRLVKNLLRKRLNVGMHNIVWQPDNLASGIYYYRLITNGKSLTRKSIFLK